MGSNTDEKNVSWAEISPVPPDDAGKILARDYAIIASLFSFGLLIGIFGGLGLILWGLLTGFQDTSQSVSPSARQLGTILIVAGGTCFCTALVIALVHSSFFFSRYMRNVLRRELASRTSTLVDSNDRAARFVEYVPKTNWGKVMLHNPSDVGLMVVDRKRREIRFEGDKERWRIPAGAITRCAFEVSVRKEGNTKMYYVVLQANHPAGFWEAPIRPGVKAGLLSDTRKKATKKLFQAIQSLRAVKPSQDARVSD